MIEKEWVTQAGYPAKVVAQPMGHRCGYVTLPENHPDAVKDYDSIDVSVHGGLTYADGLTVGFDCAHFGDRRDPALMAENYRKAFEVGGMVDFEDGVVRTLEFCIEECESLAAQLKSHERN